MKELSNVQELLVAQYNLNKAAQEEVKSLTEKIEQEKKEFEVKLQEYSHLLDLRSARIQVKLNLITYCLGKGNFVVR